MVKCFKESYVVLFLKKNFCIDEYWWIKLPFSNLKPEISKIISCSLVVGVQLKKY